MSENYICPYCNARILDIINNIVLNDDTIKKRIYKRCPFCGNKLAIDFAYTVDYKIIKAESKQED